MQSISALKRDMSTLNREAKKAALNVLYDAGNKLLIDFKERSAEDTGLYKSGWTLRKIKDATGIGFILKNDVSYADVLISGAEQGGPPWFFSSRKRSKKTGKFVKSGSGKLFVRKGRVWAGGQSPGKQKAAGGVMAGLISKPSFYKKVERDISKATIGKF